MRWVKPLSVVLMFLMLTVPITQAVKGQNINEYKEFEAKFKEGDIYENPEAQNLGNSPENITTNKDIWERDMGDIPRGIYRGVLFPPSKTELGYKPRWRNEYNHQSDYTKGMFGYTNLIQKVRVGSDKIMNGATEFYIQVPVDADSLKVLQLKGDYLLSKGSNYFSSIQIYEGDYNPENLETSFHKTRITQKSSFGNTKPEMVVPIKPSDYHGDQPYVKVNGYFKPDETYTFVFNLLTGEQKPQLYVTGSDNFQSTSIQYGKQRINQINSVLNNTGRRLYGTETVDENNKNWSYSSLVINDAGETIKETKNTDVHLSTSFIFTEGIGKNKMFGKTLHINAGEHLQFYPDTNWSKSNRNISFYLPFISEEKIGGTDTPIEILFGNDNAYYGEGQITKSTHVNDNITWSYRDFILFTDSKSWYNEDVNITHVNSKNVWDIYFKEDITITIPCHGLETQYEFVDNYSNDAFECRWKGAKMLLTSSPEDTKKETFDGRFEFFYYNPYIVSELTEGVWGQVDNLHGDPKETYTHAYPVYEYYSNITVQMVDEKDQTITRTVSDNGGGKGHDKDLIQKIKDILMNGLNSLWEGGKKLIGQIYDGLKFVWNQLQNIFNIIQNSVLNFIDWIKGVIGDAMNVLGTLFQRIAFIGGLLGFVGTATVISKVTKVAGGER